MSSSAEKCEENVHFQNSLSSTEGQQFNEFSSFISPSPVDVPTKKVETSALVDKNYVQDEAKKSSSIEDQQPNENVYYHSPTWSSPCPAGANYQLEVVKNGITLVDDTVNFSSVANLQETPEISFCIFGRQPRSALPPDSVSGMCTSLLHPSISRVHAILQYGSNPRMSDMPAGWYIYDRKSTHGTFVNKHRVPPNRYIRLHVGYVIRFGNSTRLFVLQGPDSDLEPESKESWSELVSAHKKRIVEESRLTQLEEKLKKKKGDLDAKSLSSHSEVSNAKDPGCNWGIDDSDAPEDSEEARILAGFALGGSCLSHESAYADDPKRALKEFFDREGFDAPEYEFVEGRFGQQNCRLELPLNSGSVYAEATVCGKRKEAIAACALEACHLLDRLGEFDCNKESAEAVKLARQKAYWEENDYYSSDEDPFLDRTGQLEMRRRKRMRRTAHEGAEQPETILVAPTKKESFLEILSQLEPIGTEIIEVERKLIEAEKAFAPSGENVSEMDELEAYMEAIKRGAAGRTARDALKKKLFDLRKTESIMLRQLGIRQSMKGAFCSSASSAAAAAVRAKLGRQKEIETSTNSVESSEPNIISEGKTESKLNSLKRLLTSSIKVIPITSSPVDSNFEPEEEDLEATSETPPVRTETIEDGDFPSSIYLQSDIHSSPMVNAKSSIGKNDDHLAGTPQLDKEAEIISPSSYSLNSQAVDVISYPSNASTTSHISAVFPVLPANMSSLKVNKHEDSEHSEELPLTHTSLYPSTSDVSSPSVKLSSVKQLPVSQTTPSKRPKLPKAIEARFPESDFYDISNPDYAIWIPPTNQKGDGITDLNAKYGY